MRRRVPAVGAGHGADPESVERFPAEVRLFAWLAELARTRVVRIELPRGASAEQVIAQALKVAGLSDAPGVAGCARLAVNHEYAEVGTKVRPGDELALIPPVSGGAPPHVRVTEEPLDLLALHELVRTERAGAIVVLTGHARGADELHYEAYAEMAATHAQSIAEQLLRRYKLETVAIEHRVGELAAGEAVVAVAASAAEPAAAFAAAHEAIDRIRAELPVWRLEREGGYRSWVRGEPIAARIRSR